MNDTVEHAIEEILEDEETNIHRVPVVRQLSVAFGILVLIFGTSYVPKIVALLSPTEANSGLEAQAPQPAVPQPVVAKNPFENVHVTAVSAYVWDVAEQRALYNKNADDAHPLASITKLMTAIVAHELVGNTETVTISQQAILQDGDSGLLEGESFSSAELLDLTLITSSNDGAYALAEEAGNSIDNNGVSTFVDAMNLRAEEIGLSATYFKNPTGLDISESEAGAYGSARDVAFLMEHVITTYPSIVERTQENLISIANREGLTHRAQNTNQAVNDVPGLIASKTGYTDLAGGNLVIAFNAGLNRPIIVSVLGSTHAGRFNDVETLVNAALDAVSQ